MHDDQFRQNECFSSINCSSNQTFDDYCHTLAQHRESFVPTTTLLKFCNCFFSVPANPHGGVCPGSVHPDSGRGWRQRHPAAEDCWGHRTSDSDMHISRHCGGHGWSDWRLLPAGPWHGQDTLESQRWATRKCWDFSCHHQAGVLACIHVLYMYFVLFLCVLILSLLKEIRIA